MTISDEIRAIRDKYTPKHIKLAPSSYCRNEYARSLGECEKCGICGREFTDDGKVMFDPNEFIKNGIDTRPIFVQLEEVYGGKKNGN